MGRSFRLCTARSASRRSTASVISLVKAPFPPIAWSVASWNRSPLVFRTWISTVQAGVDLLSRAATQRDCHMARAEPREAIDQPYDASSSSSSLVQAEHLAEGGQALHLLGFPARYCLIRGRAPGACG